MLRSGFILLEWWDHPLELPLVHRCAEDLHAFEIVGITIKQEPAVSIPSRYLRRFPSIRWLQKLWDLFGRQKKFVGNVTSRHLLLLLLRSPWEL